MCPIFRCCNLRCDSNIQTSTNFSLIFFKFIIIVSLCSTCVGITTRTAPYFEHAIRYTCIPCRHSSSTRGWAVHSWDVCVLDIRKYSIAYAADPPQVLIPNFLVICTILAPSDYYCQGNKGLLVYNQMQGLKVAKQSVPVWVEHLGSLRRCHFCKKFALMQL